MSRTLRTILIIVAALVVLLFIAPFLIPVDKFRPTIEDKASAAIGRKVELGKLSFSLLGGSLTAETLSVGDDPKFSPSPFLTAKSVKVGVEVLPLIFSKSINVTGVTIDTPQVTLLRNTAGAWNYSSLGGSAAKSSAPSSSAPADFSVKSFELKDGRIIIGSVNSQKRSTYDHVSVTASDVSLKSKFPVTVSVDLPAGGKFKLDGNAGPVDAADSSLTPLDAKISVSGLNLASTGFVDAGAGLGGLLDLEATITSANGEAEVKGSSKLSKALLVAGGSPASEPVTVDFNTKYNLHKNSGVLNPSEIKIGKAVAHLGGTYVTEGEATILSMKVTGENMPAQDLQTFLPALGVNLPKGASIQGGTLSTNLNLSGPTSKLLTTGNVGLYSAKLAGFDLGSKMSAISSLTGMKTGKDLEIEKLTTNLKMAPTGLEADNFVAVITSIGNLVGGGTIDSKNNLDFKMAATITGVLGAVGSPVSGAAGMLGKLTGGSSGSNCKSGTTVPFLIQGTTAEPKFLPDVGGLAASMLKSQLGCAAGVIPGTKGPNGQTQNPVKSLTGLFGKKKS